MPKGSSIALILGGNKKKSKNDNLMGFDPEEESEEGIGGDDAFDEAAALLLQAIQENDTEAFSDALKDAIKICVEQREAEGY